MSDGERLHQGYKAVGWQARPRGPGSRAAGLAMAFKTRSGASLELLARLAEDAADHRPSTIRR
jgi:hypothetical protein